MQNHKVVNYLIYAQLSFFLLLAVAINMTTAGFQNNHGLSFYGEHLPTAIPFILGFVICDFFLLRACSVLAEDRPLYKNLSLLIKILAVLLILIPLTPDNLNSFFNWSHIIASTALFLFELSFATWLTARWYRDKLILLLLGAQLLASILAMLSQFGIVAYLSEGILFFQFFFGMLLIRSFSRLLQTG